MNKKEAMLKIFPGISEDSPCEIRALQCGGMKRLGLYYNETCIAKLSKDMEEEYNKLLRTNI
jgi:hypothetical protein